MVENEDHEGPCECGAEEACRPLWYEALAEEQIDAVLGQWHNPLVCIFALQHRSMFREKFADGQFRFLQLFVERGPGAVNAVARSLRKKNKGAGVDLEAPELLAYEGIGAADFPAGFALSMRHLRTAEGDFLADGYDAYGERMVELAVATLQAWRDARRS